MFASDEQLILAQDLQFVNAARELKKDAEKLTSIT